MHLNIWKLCNFLFSMHFQMKNTPITTKYWLTLSRHLFPRDSFFSFLFFFFVNISTRDLCIKSLLNRFFYIFPYISVQLFRFFNLIFALQYSVVNTTPVTTNNWIMQTVFLIPNKTLYVDVRFFFFWFPLFTQILRFTRNLNKSRKLYCNFVG